MLDIKKMEALLQDEGFKAEMETKENVEQIVALYNAYGVEVTEEEFAQLADKGLELMKENGFMDEEGELSPEMLEMVSGGGKAGKIFVLTVLGIASACAGHPEGTILCIVAGIAVLADGNSKKKKKK